eukprot:CAMPEP_0179069252 /NCGR_PEP_ID=MMETSP0796-20121207/30413_1 /TAXON_ID=73915 /ORGANISM="Pyrodinium bahamense, Strain pbaha01" /LENGTH=84 /DNA_ID=CAMNT_0020766315 /DNA_START=8 /DNA_END=259 /DNA_ORIENTATION=+
MAIQQRLRIPAMSERPRSGRLMHWKRASSKLARACAEIESLRSIGGGALVANTSTRKPVARELAALRRILRTAGAARRLAPGQQ